MRLNTWLAAAAAGPLLMAVCSGSPAPTPPPFATGGPAAMDRTILPIQEPSYPPITELDVRQATPPPRFEVKPPAGAPNVLLVIIDDMGFGVPSAFGGPVHMPTADRLASEGLRYNAFHNTAVCSPTRTALLTGRNHHTNNMAGITETATAFPGNTAQLFFSADETADIGVDDGTPVTEDFKKGENAFTGRIHKVKIDVEEQQ